MTSASSTEQAADFARFSIGFDHRDRARLHALIDEVLDSERWSEGEMVARFEQAWADYNDLSAVALSSWAGGALAAAVGSAEALAADVAPVVSDFALPFRPFP